jgi:hypothetical protein
MEKQRMMSFDIGIKNMAYCIFEIHQGTNSYEIMDWNILNLMEKDEPNVFCNCHALKEKIPKKPKKEKKIVKLENFFVDSSDSLVSSPSPTNKLCGKIAKYKKENNYYCEKHAKQQTQYIIPKKQISSSQLRKNKIDDLIKIGQTYQCLLNDGENQEKKQTKKNILENLENFFKIKCLEPLAETKKHNAGDTDLITIGKNMKNLLNLIREIELVNLVIIENQISPIANRMKTIQGMLAQYFIMKNSEIKIEFVSSANKLKGFSKNDGEKQKKEEKIEEKTEKQKYSQHKKDGVFYTNQMLEKDINLHTWKNSFNESKKKDDLADCFLQGIWYLNSRNRIE